MTVSSNICEEISYCTMYNKNNTEYTIKAENLNKFSQLHIDSFNLHTIFQNLGRHIFSLEISSLMLRRKLQNIGTKKYLLGSRKAIFLYINKDIVSLFDNRQCPLFVKERCIGRNARKQ